MTRRAELDKEAEEEGEAELSALEKVPKHPQQRKPTQNIVKKTKALC